MKEVKTYRFPMTLGARVDRLKKLDQEKSAANARVKELEAEERALEQAVILELERRSLDGAAGKLVKAKIVRQEVPIFRAEGGDEEFYKWLGRTKRFEMLQKRLSSAAIREAWANKEKIPGLDVFIHKKLSLTKP